MRLNDDGKVSTLGLQIRTLNEVKKETTHNMIFPKLLILTLFIFGPFAKGSLKNMEERIEALERKLATLTMADEMEAIETNRNSLMVTYFVSG